MSMTRAGIPPPRVFMVVSILAALLAGWLLVPSQDVDAQAAEGDAALSVSVGPLTEGMLDGTTVDLEIANEVFADPLEAGAFTILARPPGLTIGGVTRIDGQRARLTLAFDGTDFDTDYHPAIAVLPLGLAGASIARPTETFTVTADVEASPPPPTTGEEEPSASGEDLPAGTVSVGGVPVPVAASGTVGLLPGTNSVLSLDAPFAALTLEVPGDAVARGNVIDAHLASGESLGGIVPPPEGASMLAGAVIDSPQPFQVPARLTLRFPSGTEEAALVLARWTGATWEYIDATVSDSEGVAVSAGVSGPGTYAALSDPAVVLLRAIDGLPGGVSTLEWFVPGVRYQRVEEWPFEAPPRALWTLQDGRWVASALDAPAFMQQRFAGFFPDGVVPEGTSFVVVK